MLLDLISSVAVISLSIPEQFKNWFRVLSVYVIVLIPLRTVPVASNPTVESTVITEDPAETLVRDFVFGVTSKSPSIRSLLLYPIKSANL